VSLSCHWGLLQEVFLLVAGWLRLCPPGGWRGTWPNRQPSNALTASNQRDMHQSPGGKGAGVACGPAQLHEVFELGASLHRGGGNVARGVRWEWFKAILLKVSLSRLLGKWRSVSAVGCQRWAIS
jgi:hypothetical protein